MGDQTSRTILSAVETEMDGIGIGLEDLARRAEQLFVFFGLDGAPAGELALDALDQKSPDNCICFKTICKGHGLNGCASDHLKKVTDFEF